MTINNSVNRGLRLIGVVLGLAWAVGVIWSTTRVASAIPEADQGNRFVGSQSCRQCHEKFYQLWAPSHHGLAMQPYSPEFAADNLTTHDEAIQIGAYSYRSDIRADQGVILEQGPEGKKQYPIVHVLGGKNVYYFLTPHTRGRLQTLPLAYNVNTKKWFDTAASGVRHFPGDQEDAPVHWTDPLYTFNTGCYSCHVSQLSNNYDLKTDTYNTTWAEPGINCETCHGPAEEHVKAYLLAQSTGVEPESLGLISTSAFDADQTNSMCNTCHAKMSEISPSFKPGDSYFDHFDLVTLENPDFYPDGRDLGENYTMTSWRMSPCLQEGTFDCLHCHTSSGRYRFAEPERANHACLPCHQENVDQVAGHSKHVQGPDAPRCISCHMPMTQFAHMNRTDHSMRPPVPAATLKYESPNACNLCHQDQDATWAQEKVTEWGRDSLQAEILKLAAYVDQARKEDWSQLDEILKYIQSPDRKEIVTASLIRLLRACASDKKWPVMIEVMERDASPFIRATAAEALHGYLAGDSVAALVKATTDDLRLVRVRAAASLAALPEGQLEKEQQRDLDLAMAELTRGMISRPDDYAAHYNLGNIYMAQRKLDYALTSYQTSIKLRPDFVPPYVNAAFVHNAQQQNDKAAQSFRKALAIEPNSVITQTNYAMLLGEMGRMDEAQQAYRKVLSIDPNSATAAFNLGVMLAEKRPFEALAMVKKAHELQPDDPKYSYTYAFYLKEQGRLPQAIQVLRGVVNNKVPYSDAYVLLAHLFEAKGDFTKARAVYQQGAGNAALPQQVRQYFQVQAGRLGGGRNQ